MKDNVLADASEALQSLASQALVACYAEDFVFEDASSGQRITDKKQLLEYYQRLFSWPGVAFSKIEFFQHRERAAGEWVWSGLSIQKGQPFEIRGASIFVVVQDRIIREAIYYDLRDALK